MHRLLELDDVLDQIFYNLDLATAGGRQPRNPSQAYQATALLSAALTCKTLFEPAMRHLWNNIAGLDLLLLTMGQNIIGFKYNDDEPIPRKLVKSRTSARLKHVVLPRAFITFTREPTEEDWEPFDRYAKYVQRFGRITEDWGPSPDRIMPLGTVVDALANHYSKKPVLPNLRYLVCVEEQLRYARFFISAPELHTMNLHLRIPSSLSYSMKVDLAHFLSQDSLSKRDSVRLHSKHSQHDLSPSISQTILDLAESNIMPKKLDICGIPLTPEAFKATLTLHKLTSISVDLQRFNLNTFTDFSSERTFDKFEIHSYVLPTGAEKGGSLECCFYSRLLQQFNAPKLSYFTFIGGPTHPTPQDLRAMFETLMGERQHAMVKSICLEHVQGDEEPAFEGDLQRYICSFSNTFHVLDQPRFSLKPRFPHLHSILLTNVLTDLLDQDFDALGRSLPNLTTFVVSNKRDGRIGRPRVTLIGFWFLAKHCRRLKRFSIWMNAILNCSQLCSLMGLGDLDKPAAEAKAFDLVADVNVEDMVSLDVGDSLIENSIIVNKFLSAIAPNLRSFSFNRERNSREVNTLWAHVGSQISGSLRYLL